MIGDFNIWLIVAGVGIFLIGIQMLENALKNMMSRPFKLFLRKQTGNPFKAIFSGTIITAILQSSSAVNFMVLAFVSTGVITMRNAFAVIMGTNLGTTLDSWIVATVGFKVDIEAFAYPVVGIAGVVLFIFEDRVKLKNICSFLIGFSFLFIGLGFMKDAVENEYLKNIFSDFSGRSAWVFLLMGFIATSITQSSSATIAITLSILNQQLIGFESAIAVVIGSEVGTSVKLILGSLDGVVVKKRVATGNFIYNIVTTIFAFAFLQPIAWFITDVISLKDPLIGLVTFQTGINLVSILIFLPFLNRYSKFIERIFKDKEEHVSAFIYKTKPTVADTSIDLLRKETEYFVNRAMNFNLFAFDIEDVKLVTEEQFSQLKNVEKYNSKTFSERYDLVKTHHGEIQKFYIQLHKKGLSDEQAAEADQLIEAVRSMMHAVKNVKDTHADVEEMKNSSEDVKYASYEARKKEIKELYEQLNTFFEIKDKDTLVKEMLQLLEHIQEHYKKNLNDIYNAEAIHTITHLELATLINVNRELFTAGKAMVMSLKSLLLPPALSETFSELPTYQA